MTYRSLYHVLLLMLLLMAFGWQTPLAQSYYAVNGTVFVEDGSVTGTTVSLVDGTNRQKLAIDAKGAFSAKLAWGKIYYFDFSKPGYVSKIVEFSTVVPESTHLKAVSPYELQVKLFKVFDGVDSMFFKQPVAKVFFDVRTRDFIFDKDYSLIIAKRIEQMRKGVKIPNSKAVVSVDKPKGTTGKLTPKEMDKLDVVKRMEVPLPIQAQIGQESNAASSKVLPPIKAYYTEGRTVEEFDLENKMVTRVIVKNNKRQKVLLKVKHNWGPTYYFVDESPLTIRCVSKAVYERETLLRGGDN